MQRFVRQWLAVAHTRTTASRSRPADSTCCPRPAREFTTAETPRSHARPDAATGGISLSRSAHDLLRRPTGLGTGAIGPTRTSSTGRRLLRDERSSLSTEASGQYAGRSECAHASVPLRGIDRLSIGAHTIRVLGTTTHTRAVFSRRIRNNACRRQFCGPAQPMLLKCSGTGIRDHPKRGIRCGTR